MRLTLFLLLLVVLVGCGEHKPSAYSRANTALLDSLPVFPGSSAPKTTSGRASSTEFGARDWTLPAKTTPEAVIDWYVERLQSRGWNVGGKSFNTIRATRGNASVSVGVRDRTLELVANSRGA